MFLGQPDNYLAYVIIFMMIVHLVSDQMFRKHICLINCRLGDTSPVMRVRT